MGITFDEEEVINKVCNAIKSYKKSLRKDYQLTHANIFRILTNKKIFEYDFEVDDSICEIDDSNCGLVKLVKSLNPFFDFSNACKDKINFYKTYYCLTESIFDHVSEEFNKRRRFNHYQIADITNETKVKNYRNVFSESEKYVFESIEEAMEGMKKYSESYRKFELELKLALCSMSCDNRELERKMFSIEEMWDANRT